jgi:hypothetical protein
MTEADNTKATVYGSTSQKLYVEMETNNDGHPLLSDQSEWPKKSLDRKSLIQSYVAVAYRELGNIPCL